MDGFFSRALLSAYVVLVFGSVGLWIGEVLHWPRLGALIGAGTGAAVHMLLDGWRGHLLMEWLRGSIEKQAPRDAGFWGEIGYRIERALRTRELTIAQERDRLQQFLSAIEASPNGVLMLDANDQIDWCNATAADHFGLDPVRDRGQRVTNLVRSPIFVGYLQAAAFDQPVQLVGPSGLGTLSVLVRPYGEGLRLVLSQDVTERERADAMRRDFVSNVSHEIRTPLTVLAGFVETMSALPLNEGERTRVLALMTQQTQRMQALVADLLILARLEGSPRPPADRWQSVAALLQRVRADGESLSAGRHEFIVAGGEDADIAGSDTELLSAVGNLVGNAIRYTAEGGRIDVSWAWRRDGSGELVVADTGIGIAREHLPRLTERFYRVDGSRSRESGGTGLGLSIVKHAVQRHGGEIDIESELGKGSRFRLVFPASRVRRTGARISTDAEMA